MAPLLHFESTNPVRNREIKMDSLPPSIDLPRYFARIGYTGEQAPTADVLKAIHLAHATHIPFENLDVLAGAPIRLTPEGLQAKLVDAERGGYCFEQNMLLAYALESIGFRLKRLLARVRFRSNHMLPLTHMALEVEADGQGWLCDVGFGGHGLLEPIPLREGDAQQGAWHYRLAREDGFWWVLQAPLIGDFVDLYTFTRHGYQIVDFEPPNFFVSRHPESIFLVTLMAQRPLLDVRYLLVGRDYSEIRPSGTTIRTIEDQDELRQILLARFGLEPPAGLLDKWPHDWEKPRL